MVLWVLWQLKIVSQANKGYMRKLITLLIIPLLLTGCNPHEVKLANRIIKSSIVIKVKVKDMETGREGWALCSGTQLKEGILTNAHCFEEDKYEIKQLWIRGYDGKSWKATIEKIDVDKDLALLHSDAHYTNATLSGSPLKQGEAVYAIGHGLGLENTFSVGICSFINRRLAKRDNIHYIQTTMPINGGFSGSGLYNSKGQLCGVNEAVITPDFLFHSWSGITLAIGLQDVKEFLK